MSVKAFIRSTCFSLFLFVVAHDAYGSETCYIDGNPIYLYKTINWWYDSLPEESHILCGKPIRCIAQGGAQIAYDPSCRKVTIEINSGIASMLLALKTCHNCFGPSGFTPAWLNPHYFKGAAIDVLLGDASKISGVVISNVTKDQARLVKNIAHSIKFELEGVIGGLSNSQIALHESGKLLKSCRVPTLEQRCSYPISLKMIDASNNKTLAAFTMHWDH